MKIFLDSHNRCIQDPGCEEPLRMYTSGSKGDMEPPPSKDIGQKSSSISISLNKFHSYNILSEAKDFYCQQQSLQYPIFPSRARDKPNKTKYKKILDAADFANRKPCSFIRRNDTFRKTLLRQPKNPIREPSSVWYARLLSNWHVKLWKTFFIYIFYSYY